jgi:hypothetical protein
MNRRPLASVPVVARRFRSLALPLAALLSLSLSLSLSIDAQQGGSRREIRPLPKTSSAVTEDPRITRTKERYHFAAWPRKESRRDGVLLAEFTYPGFAGEGVEFAPGSPVVLRYAGEDGAPWFLVEFTVRETAAAAREDLVATLAHVSSLEKVPTTASSGIEAGEIGFVGFSRGERISWIAFVRGNISVRICCLDPRATPHPDLRRLAERTDRLIQARPRLTGKTGLTRPEITALRVEREKCIAGEAVLLEPGLDEAAAWHWEIRGPGLGYVERDEEGRWVLHTTGPGRIEVVCHVLGTNAVASSRSAAIVVEDD